MYLYCYKRQLRFSVCKISVNRELRMWKFVPVLPPGKLLCSSGRHTAIGARMIWLYLALTASPHAQGRTRWVFQSLPRPVGFTWKSLYDSGSPTPLKVCVVRGAVHPRCCRPSPVRFTAPVRLLADPTARRWDYRTRPDVRIGTEPSVRWNEQSSPPLATCRPWKPKCS